jgi:hypothetical protein
MFPPKVVVKDEETMRQLSEESRDGLMQFADDVGNHGAALHPRIVGTLQKYGLDAGGRFGIGATSAHKAADSVHRLLQQAAEHAMAAASYMQAANAEFYANVVVPVEAYHSMQTTGGNTLDM